MAGRHAHPPGRRAPGKVAAAQLSRRRLFAGLGAGAAGAVALGATGTAYADHQNQSGQAPADRFGRMFPDLPAYQPANDQTRQAMMELGAPGGLLDASDALDAGPAELILDESLSANNPNNTSHTAGTTFVGQFLDHDITFDTTSALGFPTPPQDSPNIRTPALDLDSVYGAGPVADPELYQPDGVRLRIESGGVFEDVPRMGSGTAVISDPRNDENEIIKGIQAAVIMFHNEVVQRLQDDGFPGGPGALFNEARRIVTWHYQWMVVHEFLPLFVGQQMVDDILNGGRLYYHPDPGPAFIPIEFQLAYRFGHSMVRPSYALNLDSNDGDPFFGFIFDPSQEGSPDPDDLRAGVRAPRRFVSWNVFFDFQDGNLRPNKMIDRVLSTPLFNLPLQTIASGDPPTSLAQRNFLRHLTWETPSGQQIAQQMGHQMLHLPELAGIGGGLGLENQSPLWYYVLAEAEDLAGGLTLGPTGGRIVGEVFIGMLQLDPASYLAVDPSWQPFLGSAPGVFTMTDLLTVAGVDPASREGGGGPGPGPGGDGCTATMVVDSQWQSGYVIQVTVTNDTDSTISGWNVAFTLPAGHQIVNQWNASISGAPDATATGVSFNSNLGPGQTATWGFQASRPGDGQLPTGFDCSTT